MSAEQLVWAEKVFHGKLVNVRVDTVRLPDQSLREREVVEHPGAVAILPVLEDGRIVLVRQYRHAVGRELLEVPAGTREPDESPEDCAIRELAEETGYRTNSVEEVARFWISPGWCNEQLISYRATGLTTGNVRLEDDEDIDVVTVALDDVPSLIASGDIGDAKTLIAIQLYKFG